MQLHVQKVQMEWQTLQTMIQLLLKDQFNLGLHCLCQSICPSIWNLYEISLFLKYTYENIMRCENFTHSIQWHTCTLLVLHLGYSWSPATTWNCNGTLSWRLLLQNESQIDLWTALYVTSNPHRVTRPIGLHNNSWGRSLAQAILKRLRGSKINCLEIASGTCCY